MLLLWLSKKLSLNSFDWVSYLIYDSIAERGKSCRKKNITTLKCSFEEVGKISENPVLQEIIINSDIPSVPRCKLSIYTEEEQKMWSRAVNHMNEQVGRAFILHMMLGTRISEVLTIKKQGTVPKRKYMNKEADDTVSTQFEVTELKACNEKLLEENQKLKKEVEVLKNKIARKEISILKKI